MASLKFGVVVKNSLTEGSRRVERIVVDCDRTIAFLGEELRIYSTPSMVHDVEYACFRLIDEYLQDGESSLGIDVQTEHLGATPIGAWVEVAVTVTRVDGRRITLSAEVRDAVELVGRGEHTRVVIDIARHGKRIREKAAAIGAARP